MRDRLGYELFESKLADTFKCSKCKYYKTKDAFYKSKYRVTGVRGLCKCCDLEESRLKYIKKQLEKRNQK